MFLLLFVALAFALECFNDEIPFAFSDVNFESLDVQKAEDLVGDVVAVRLTRSLGVGRGVLVVRDGDAQSATKLQRLRVTQALAGTRAVFSIGESAATTVSVVSSATRGTAPWRLVVGCLSALATHALAAPCSLQLELKLNWPCDRAAPASLNNALKILDERQCDGTTVANSSSGVSTTSTSSATTSDGNASTTTAAPATTTTTSTASTTTTSTTKSQTTASPTTSKSTSTTATTATTKSQTTTSTTTVPLTTANPTPAPSGIAAWVPPPGGAAFIGYEKGKHPQPTMRATLFELDPINFDWNPDKGKSSGPWTADAHGFQTLGAYCGAVFIESLRVWMARGSGHVTINVPSPYGYEVDTLSWKWFGVPVPSDGAKKIVPSLIKKNADVYNYYPREQFDADWGDWNGSWSGWPTGFARPGEIFPEAAHTYNHLVFVPGSVVGNTNGHFLDLAGVMGKYDHLGTVQTGHIFNLDTFRFERMTSKNPRYPGPCGGACYDPVTKLVFVASRSSTGYLDLISIYNPVTRTWNETSSTNSLLVTIDDGGILPHPPSRLLLHWCPATASGATYNEADRFIVSATSSERALSNGFTWNVLNVSASSWPRRQHSAYGNSVASITWVYVKDNGCYYCINGMMNSTTLWKMCPPTGATAQQQYLTGTWTVTTEELSAPLGARAGYLGAPNTREVYTRMVYDPLNKVLLFQMDYHEGRMLAIKPRGI